MAKRTIPRASEPVRTAPKEKLSLIRGGSSPSRDSACTRCGRYFSSHKEQCPHCYWWRPSERAQAVANDMRTPGADDDQTILLSNVKESKIPRLVTGLCDHVFGYPAGIACTSVNLLGGEPGAGKSTIALQLVDALAPLLGEREAFYICAEQGAEDLKSACKRLKLKHFDKIRIYPMGANSDISEIIMRRKPGVIFVDSIQALIPDYETAADFALGLKGYCVAINSPAFIISQINKDGDVKGHESLSHHVDAVFTLFKSGRDPDEHERILVSGKNRFGRENQQQYFMMGDRGLELSAADAFSDDADE